jgi:acyl-CoA dehydrogenase
MVMARTDPEAPRHRRFSTFLVDLPNPGYRILRDIPVMGQHRGESVGHAEVEIKDLIVPRENLLGGRGEGFNLGQHRLGYGRLRHGFRNIGLAQRALDLAAQRVTERSTFGAPLADRQGVLWMLADCATELHVARLMVLHIAYKMEHKLDLRQENSMAKVYLANMVHKVVDTALQLHGALGYSHDTPLADWYTAVRSQRFVDGPDEVHRWTVGRNLIRACREHGTTAPAAGGDLV